MSLYFDPLKFTHSGSLIYRTLLKENGVIASYSVKGYTYNNVIIESYHASLKRECLYWYIIKDLKHAKQLVFSYNYGFYNTKRIHQSLENLTPNDFIKQWEMVA